MPEPTESGEVDGQSTTTQPATATRSKLARRVPVSRRTVAVLATTLGCIGVGIYFAVASSPSGQTAAGNAPGSTARPAGTAIPGPMPGAPGARQSAAPAQVLDAPKPLRPAASSSSKVKAWNKGPGSAALLQVTEQSGSALMAHGAGQYPEMLQACRALTKAVQQAEEAPPIPDAAMQKEYAKTLNVFRDGAADCTTGISQRPEGVEDTVTSVNKTVLGRAVKQLDDGQTDLYIATEVLRKQ